MPRFKSYYNKQNKLYMHTAPSTVTKNLSPVLNHVIPLTLILQNNTEAIMTFSKELMTRGYAFVKLSLELVSQIDSCLKIIDNFFTSVPLEYKKLYAKPPIFGYFNVDHKESFRLLTGSRLDEQKIPKSFNEIKNLIHTVDQIMFALSLICSPILFPDIMKKSKELNIPLFNVKKQWAMFDFAKYYNDGSRSELNCKEHFDPGLLSISLRSTEPGLQLKDEFGKWIKTPEDKHIAIIWAGDAAHKLNPKIKHGIHRVVNSTTGRPRISMWHEICTAYQEHTELLDKDKKLDAYKFEGETGIPMSKSAPPPMSSTRPKSPKNPVKPSIPISELTGLPMFRYQ